MLRLRFTTALTAAFVWMAVVVTAAPPAAKNIVSPFTDPQWTVADIAGRMHQPWSASETEAVVLVFIGTNCPISNYYQPTLRTLQQQFPAPKVAWYYVHTDPQLTAAVAARHARDYSIAVPVVLDPQHSLARAAGATKLPQAAVITRDGSIAYLGRIDDTYVGYGKKRAAPSQRDLQTAIAAVLAGQPVATPRTESVGCFIPFATAGTAPAQR